MIKASNNLTGKLNASIIHVYPELENIEITPAVEDQEFKSDMYGYDKVRVKGVQSYIDEDIKPEYIKDGVDILGVVGSYKGVDSSDATATSEDILAGKTAYVNNEKIEGTIQEYDGSYTGDTSEGIKITNTRYLFYNNSRNDCINELLKFCKDVTVASEMFYECSKLTELDLKDFDTTNVLRTTSMFSGCSGLTNLNMSNCNLENVINVQAMFIDCNSLVNLKSFKNLGKGYAQRTANYVGYKLDLHYSTKLTYESLIDIINNLYDLNLTYDVANGGTLYRQSLVLGSTNLAKLTEEEITIATNKGWDVT